MTDVLTVMDRQPQEFDAGISAVQEKQPVFAPVKLRTSSELAALPISELSAIIGQDVAGLDPTEVLRRARDAQLANLFPLNPRNSTPLPEAATVNTETAAEVIDRKPRVYRKTTPEERDAFLKGLLGKIVDIPIPVPNVEPEPVREEETGKPISWLADLVAELPQQVEDDPRQITTEVPIQEERIRRRRVRAAARILVRGALMGGTFLALGFINAPDNQSVSRGPDESVDENSDDEQANGAVIATVETEATVETVNTLDVAETTTTTAEVLPKSLAQKVYDGEISMWDTAGKRFDSMSMSAPGMCLDDIHLYGSNFASIEDETLQTEFFIPNGLMSAEEAQKINDGTMPYAQKASIYERFDPTYYVAIDETPQVACDATTDSANPPRWIKLPTGSQSALDLANEGINLGSVQPTAEFDLEAGVMPGQIGNVVVAAHNRTQGGAFWNLDALGPGDIVTFKDKDLGEVSYVYEKSETLQPTLEANQQIISYESEWSDSTLTLYACFKGDDGVSYRRIVRFVLVK